MKLSITPVALAVTMALGAAAAQAQTVPSYGTTNVSETGLYLAVWDDTTKATDLVNLTATFTQLSLLNGQGVATTNTGLTTPTSAYSLVANPTGAGGEVEQLNLGNISNFVSTFPSVSSTTEYAVLAVNSGFTGVLVSQSEPNELAGLAVNTMSQAIVGEVSDWGLNSSVSPQADTTGNAAYNVTLQGNAIEDGELGLGAGNYFGTHVGSAANFYDYAAPTSGANSGNFYADEYGNSNGAGFWFLTSSGDLTWNLLTSSNSTVPLPPAVWLFASGLIGLGLIGRRRQGGFGAAA